MYITYKWQCSIAMLATRGYIRRSWIATAAIAIGALMVGGWPLKGGRTVGNDVAQNDGLCLTQKILKWYLSGIWMILMWSIRMFAGQIRIVLLRISMFLHRMAIVSDRTSLTTQPTNNEIRLGKNDGHSYQFGSVQHIRCDGPRGSDIRWSIWSLSLADYTYVEITYNDMCMYIFIWF